jgi:hypothetical protein
LTYFAGSSSAALVAVQRGTSGQRTVSTGRSAIALVVGAVAVRVAADVPLALDRRELDWGCINMTLGMRRCSGTDGGKSSDDTGGNGETHGEIASLR